MNNYGAEFFRKYADIITEAERPATSPQQVAKVLQAELSPEEQQALISIAEKIVGKPLSQLTPAEAQKYGPAVEKALSGGGLAEQQLDEINLQAAWNTAKSKLGVLGAIGGMGAAAAGFAAAGDYGSAGTVSGPLLLGLAALAGNIPRVGQEYQLQKKLLTTTDPEEKLELQKQIGYMKR